MLVTGKQLLQHAMKTRTAVGAFNATTMEAARAIIHAAE